MTDKRVQQMADQSNTEKNPEDWTTGDEPMTGAQRSYLKTLSEEAKLPFDENLTKAQASMRIDELQRVTGRGQPRESSQQQGAQEQIVANEEESVATLAEADSHGGETRGVSDH